MTPWKEAMHGRTAVSPAKVRGMQEAPSHIGGHTAWYFGNFVSMMYYGGNTILYFYQFSMMYIVHRGRYYLIIGNGFCVSAYYWSKEDVSDIFISM